MGIDLRIYPRENLKRIEDMIDDTYFHDEFEHLYFHRDYEIFSQIDGFAKPSEIKVKASQINTSATDAYSSQLTFANCEDFAKIILPEDIAPKNKSIINYLTSLKGWLAVLYWC